MTDEKPDDLQFDRAEYAAATDVSACAACGQRLWDVYYDVDGRPLCEKCKTDVELERSQGSGIGRFVRATIYGTGAGAVGAGIWYGIRELTGYEVGLIAVVVGLLVGTAVKKGSNGRGGWLYQALAVFLTYTAIVSTYVPYILQGMKDQLTGLRGPVAAVVAFVLVFALAFIAPFLAGFQNVIGLLIIGFGLWEAWKINRATPLTITGPFRVGAPPPAPAPGG